MTTQNLTPPAQTNDELIDDLIAAEGIRVEISALAEVPNSEDSGIQILALLNKLPQSVPAVDFVRAGFTISGFPTSSSHEALASKMTTSGNVAGLEYVVTQNNLGIGLKDVCTWGTFGFGNGNENVRTLAEYALEYSSAEAMRLAVKLENGEPAAGSQLNLQWLPLPSVHGTALSRAVRHVQPLVAQRYLECAEILAEHGVPVKYASYERNPVGSILLDDAWRPEMAPRLAGLLRQYHAAGQFDVNALLDSNTISAAELPPLEAAIKSGNPLAAKEIILLRCDMPMGTEDLFGYVRSLQLDNESEMLACLNEGLMTVAIERSAVGASAASGAGLVAEKADGNVPRRARRATL